MLIKKAATLNRLRLFINKSWRCPGAHAEVLRTTPGRCATTFRTIALNVTRPLRGSANQGTANMLIKKAATLNRLRLFINKSWRCPGAHAEVLRTTPGRCATTFRTIALKVTRPLRGSANQGTANMLIKKAATLSGCGFS